MSCLHLPQTLADASAIVAACGGANWRENFLFGLGTVLFFGGLAVVVALVLRARAL